MNIQTERLEDHSARFTVEVDQQRLDQAMQTAARKIARRVSIPGFRPGKAPYKVLVNYIGEGPILEDAVEELGNEIYKEALDEVDFEPYGPGQLEDFHVEPGPSFTFKVALQPTVELGDYRSVRLDFEPPTIDDEAVNRAMKALQEQQAVVEESHQPAAIGNRVTLDIHSFFVAEGQESEEKAEPVESEQPPSIDELHNHDEDEIFLHEHGAVLRLDTDDEPILPGFSAALVGAEVSGHRDFELAIPDNTEDYKEHAGRRVRFHVIVNKIETVTLPPLTDDLAARLTESEEKPLTLLELRMRVRENLEKEAERQARSNYTSRVVDRIVEQAKIAYPEPLVERQIDDFLEDLDRTLRQSGITIDGYLKLVEKTKDELRVDYRESAVRQVERMLVMGELLNAEKLKVTGEHVSGEIDRMVGQFGDQSAGLRGVFDTPQMRTNILNDLLSKKLQDRLFEIGTGSAPDIESGDSDAPTQEQASQTA